MFRLQYRRGNFFFFSFFSPLDVLPEELLQGSHSVFICLPLWKIYPNAVWHKRKMSSLRTQWLWQWLLGSKQTNIQTFCNSCSYSAIERFSCNNNIVVLLIRVTSSGYKRKNKWTDYSKTSYQFCSSLLRSIPI